MHAPNQGSAIRARAQGTLYCPECDVMSEGARKHLSELSGFEERVAEEGQVASKGLVELLLQHCQ